MREALVRPPSLQTRSSCYKRQAVKLHHKMFKLNQYLDVLIPRGGAGLIQTVIQNATVPVLETGVGNCHVFIDESGGRKNGD